MNSIKKIKNGLFITFEGPDCSGKSTQSQKLASVLKKNGYSVLETREPGGTYIGEQLRHLVKHISGNDAVCDESELLIFCASRAQLTRKVIIPFLENGGIIICDRYADSTTAYQGYGRGFDLTVIHELHKIATTGRWPDLTFLLDLDISSATSRGQMRLSDLDINDRIEEESQNFHEKVRNGYLTIAAENPDRFKVFDASEDREIIHCSIMEFVNNAISRIQ